MSCVIPLVVEWQLVVNVAVVASWKPVVVAALFGVGEVKLLVEQMLPAVLHLK